MASARQPQPAALAYLSQPPALTHSLSAPSVVPTAFTHGTNPIALASNGAEGGPSSGSRGGEKRRASTVTADGWEDDEDEDGLPDGPSQAGDAQEGQPKKPPRKRNRQALSCTECKRRKIKCDRKTPCEACCRRGEEKTCHWEAAVPTTQPQPFALATEHELLKQRVAYLESIILQGGGHIPKAPSSEPPKEVSPAAPANARSQTTDADTEDAAKALEDLGQAKLWEWASLRMNLINQLGPPNPQQPPAP